jgi:hypothetical protein
MNMSRLPSPIAAGLILLCFFTQSLVAQVKPDPYKFKPVRMDELQMTSYTPDTSAVAIILGDKGESYFESDNAGGFMIVYTRQLRIKILKPSGIEWATHEIPLYITDRKQEVVNGLKCSTYNLAGGQITEDKLKDDGVFTEKVSKNFLNKKFTMPNVHAGSVIDIKYTVRSPYFWRLPGWEFQSEIPTQWSEYKVIIPDFFNFSSLIRGYVGFVLNERTNESGDFPSRGIRLATMNVPAMTEEPYVTTINNYLSSIEFELQSYQFPMEAMVEFSTSWNKIAELFLEDADFGQQLKKGGIVKDVVSTINAEAAVDYDKMLLAYDWVKNNIKWNGNKSIFPETNLREEMERKSGTSGDLNLMLVLLLKELGLNAEPIVLSTRKNGELRETQPMSIKLNYVIAWVKIGDKEYLLDATDIDRPFNLLPQRCLNGKGLLVVKDSSRWVNLLRDERTATSYFADVKLLPDGMITGTMEVSAGGYAALDVRDEYIRLGKDEYIKHLKEEKKTWDIDEVTIEKVDEISEPVKKKYVFSSEEITNPGGDLIYLNALLDEGQKTNPFQLEKREYPVDFGAPIKDVYTINIEIPEGYKVETLPEPAKLILIDQAGSFRYMAAVNGNKITINSTLSITRPIFLQTEYPGLREFFNMIVKKHAQQIVLKKI